MLKRLLLWVGLALSLSGCATVGWYGQAVSGQLDMMQRREDIADLLADPNTDAELARQLRLVLEARQFAIDQLELPDSRSYLRYADLEREAAVWNVIAAPRDSLSPRTWCYPIVGCVAYRGYFQRERAQTLADELAEAGYDVVVWPAVAYSTLGWFADPVLNTMLRWDDASLVGFIIHELAHEKLYIRDDTTFNESYATAVERAGLRQWLNQRGEQDQLARWQADRAVRQALTELMLDAREHLREIYQTLADDAQAREQARAEVFDGLQAAIAERAEAPDGAAIRGWVGRDINNAHLVLFASYEAGVAAFKQLLASCEDNWACFHQRSADLAHRDADERARFLHGAVDESMQENPRKD
ncbi:MAG: aminopeptidase [Wenzhouxiangella sp.]